MDDLITINIKDIEFKLEDLIPTEETETGLEKSSSDYSDTNSVSPSTCRKSTRKRSNENVNENKLKHKCHQKNDFSNSEPFEEKLDIQAIKDSKYPFVLLQRLRNASIPCPYLNQVDCNIYPYHDPGKLMTNDTTVRPFSNKFCYVDRDLPIKKRAYRKCKAYHTHLEHM